MDIEKQLEQKILSIHSSIESHQVESYKAYRIKRGKRGRTFFRLYQDKITIKLDFNDIPKKIGDKYCLKDNHARYPRHELPVKGSKLNLEKYLELDFINLLRKAFNTIRR